jgi:hypothetical protein
MLLNSIWGAISGFFGTMALFLVVMAGARAFSGAPIGIIFDFLKNPRDVRGLLLFSGAIGCAGFVAGLASVKLPETEQTSSFVKFMNKYGFIAIASVINSLLLAFIGSTFIKDQGFFETLGIVWIFGVIISILVIKGMRGELSATYEYEQKLKKKHKKNNLT